MNQQLVEKIQTLHDQHRQTCGADKTWHLLTQAGEVCGRHRVARLRRSHGIVAIRMKRFHASYAARNSEPAAENLLDQNFTVALPDRLWAADTTFIPTQQGWLFLAVVIDLYARKVVGWAMSGSNNSQLVCDALTMAIKQRHPKPGLIHHSDSPQQRRVGPDQPLHLKNNSLIKAVSFTLKPPFLYLKTID